MKNPVSKERNRGHMWYNDTVSSFPSVIVSQPLLGILGGKDVPCWNVINCNLILPVIKYHWIKKNSHFVHWVTWGSLVTAVPVAAGYLQTLDDSQPQACQHLEAGFLEGILWRKIRQASISGGQVSMVSTQSPLSGTSRTQFWHCRASLAMQ